MVRELVPPLLCDPSSAASLATSSQGQSESWERGKRHREICTCIIPVSNPILCSRFLVHVQLQLWCTGSSLAKVHLSTQNISKSLIKEQLKLFLLLNSLIFKKSCPQTALLKRRYFLDNWLIKSPILVAQIIHSLNLWCNEIFDRQFI